MINQCLIERIPQQKALHLTGIYLDHNITQKRKKIIAHLKHCIYCKLINQCLTETIPQQKASHLTGRYLDQSTAEQGKKQ